MKQITRFSLRHGWKLLMADMGLNSAEVLKLAELPADLFSRKDKTLSAEEYFGFWRALEKVSGNVELPLQIGQTIAIETFDPPIFASMCSPNLNIALQRLSEFKRIIGPVLLSVDVNSKHTKVTVECYGYQEQIPHSLCASELVFFTYLARHATRQHIIPQKVTLVQTPPNLAPYDEYFGVPLESGAQNQIIFSAEDGCYPFVTENPDMWECFQPGLRQRLSELNAEASTQQRVKSILLEMLPSGQSSMEQAAKKLAMSKRTMQRRLKEEGTTFQTVLNGTREELAQHYLSNSSLASSEISFLLGFQDTNSFIRAFNSWTGETPGQYRSHAALN